MTRDFLMWFSCSKKFKNLYSKYSILQKKSSKLLWKNEIDRKVKYIISGLSNESFIIY